MESYESILQTMKEKYESCSGEAVQDCSDLDIRMSIMAEEVFSLLSYAEFLKNRMFFDTASGEDLDRHAAEHGVTRLPAEKAVGRLTFSLLYTLDYDFTVPQGTICATSDGKLRFVTTEEATISAGSLMTQVLAESENGGTKYNIPAGSVNTVVTYFSVLISVRSTSRFLGGTDAESDVSLKNRIAQRCKMPSNGLNAAYYQNIAMQNTAVASASIHAVSGEAYNLEIVIAGKGAVCSDDTVQAVQSAMTENAPVGIKPLVQKCTLNAVPISITVTAQTGYTADSVQTAVEAAVQTYFLELAVGESVMLSKIGDRVFHTAGVVNYAFADGTADTAMAYNELAVCTNLTVTVTEEA